MDSLVSAREGAMDIRKAFARALRQARTQKGLTQEDFSMVSSRTYLSALERGMKSPTLEKVEAIAGKLSVHPVTLLVLTYLQDEEYGSIEDFLGLVTDEVKELSR